MLYIYTYSERVRTMQTCDAVERKVRKRSDAQHQPQQHAAASMIYGVAHANSTREGGCRKTFEWASIKRPLYTSSHFSPVITFCTFFGENKREKKTVNCSLFFFVGAQLSTQVPHSFPITPPPSPQFYFLAVDNAAWPRILFLLLIFFFWPFDLCVKIIKGLAV